LLYSSKFLLFLDLLLKSQSKYTFIDTKVLFVCGFSSIPEEWWDKRLELILKSYLLQVFAGRDVGKDWMIFLHNNPLITFHPRTPVCYHQLLSRCVPSNG
jgi:hypothetical protein